MSALDPPTHLCPFYTLSLLYPMFFYNFVVSVDGCDPVVLRRSLPALRLLASELRSECGAELPDEVRKFADVVLDENSNITSTDTPSATASTSTTTSTAAGEKKGKKGSNNATSSTTTPSTSTTTTTITTITCPSAEVVEAALTACLLCTNVVRSAAMGRFLHEDVAYANLEGGENTSIHVSSGSTSTITATDFLLNPLETSELYVPARRSVSVDYVLNKGDSIHWRFAVAYGHGVDFMVLFKPISTSTTSDSTTTNDGANTSTMDAESEAKQALDKYLLSAKKPTSSTSSSIIASTSTDATGTTGIATAPASVATIEIITSTNANDSSTDTDGVIEVRSRTKIYTGEKARNTTTSASTTSTNDNTSVTSASTTTTPYYQDCYTAPADGVCRLVWDNTASIVYGKTIKYVINAATSAMLDAATTAARDETAKNRRQGSSVSNTIDIIYYLM